MSYLSISFAFRATNVPACCVAVLMLALSMVTRVEAADAEGISPIISGEQLSALAKSRMVVRIIDLRDKAKYDEGHVLGAVHSDLANWKKVYSKPDALENARPWEEFLGALGMESQTRVVVYGDALTDVARVWWLLRYVGAENAQLLDGGFAAYKAASGFVDTKPATVTAQKFAVSFQADRLATADEVKKFSEGAQCQIVDNRTSGEYDGTEVRGSRGGHIPGAKNLDWQKFVAADGKLRSIDELKKIVADSGVDYAKPMVTHCQSGGRSSVGALVLELLSNKPVKNYYRSWAEWSGRDDLPVAK